MEFQHKPVLLQEVLELLEPQRRTTIVDCTLGGAGHSLAIRKALPPEAWLIGIDQDDDALAAAEARLAGAGNVLLRKGNFGGLRQLLADWDRPLDGFLLTWGFPPGN